MVSTLLTAPVDMIKTRLMLQQESERVGSYRNGFHCAYQVMNLNSIIFYCISAFAFFLSSCGCSYNKVSHTLNKLVLEKLSQPLVNSEDYFEPYGPEINNLTMFLIQCVMMCGFRSCVQKALEVFTRGEFLFRPWILPLHIWFHAILNTTFFQEPCNVCKIGSTNYNYLCSL